jgi:hypothetical protein
LKFLEKFDKAFREQNNNFEAFEQNLNSYCSTENEATHHSFRNIIEKVANDYVKKIPKNDLINNCHIISDGFLNGIKDLRLFQVVNLYVTIGNIYYKGLNVYNLNEQKLESIINQGFQPDKELPIHVWLTLDDMTVFDLTIIPTLISKGIINSSEIDKPVLVWRENDISDFLFEPLLVDNDFMNRVDKMKR